MNYLCDYNVPDMFPRVCRMGVEWETFADVCLCLFNYLQPRKKCYSSFILLKNKN